MSVTSMKATFAIALATLMCPAAHGAERVYKIGIITYAGNPSSPGPSQTAGGQRVPIKDLLEKYGYIEGKNIEYEYRAGGRDMKRTEQFARELVAWKPDLIIGQMTNADIALKKATAGTDIPVVFWSTDPLEAGLIKSFARSGTNFTGFAYEPWIYMLQLRVLKTVAPETKLVAHLYNHTYAPAPSTLRGLQEAGKLMGIEIKVYEALKKDDFERAFAAMQADGADGLAVGPHELFNTNGATLGALALKYRLPTVACCQVSIARGGGLAAFSPPDGWPAMAERIDLILKGKAKPQDLPIVRSIATPFTLNLKAAEQLGLKVPASLIDEATTVIR